MAKRCSNPGCAALGGVAGHRGRHRGSQPSVGEERPAPASTKVDGPLKPPTGVAFLTVRLTRSQVEQLRDLAIHGVGPQPEDVFSDEFDVWRLHAAVIRTLSAALKGGN